MSGFRRFYRGDRVRVSCGMATGVTGRVTEREGDDGMVHLRVDGDIEFDEFGHPRTRMVTRESLELLNAVSRDEQECQDECGAELAELQRRLRS